MSRCHPETNRVKGMAKRPILTNGTIVRASLADVQPGGKVKLGDQAERARFEAWGRTESLPLARAKLGGYAFEVTAKAWLAWQYLSAEPSPGGQGDTDPMRSALEDALQFVETLHSTVSGDSRKIVWRCLERGRAALAARQPVGAVRQGCDACRRTGIRQNDEGRNICCPDCDLGRACAGDTRQPVGEPMVWLIHWSHQCGQPEATTSASRVKAVSMLSNPPRIEPLYTSPPAQSVDLGQIIEQIAQQWDGCNYDAVGETIDVGQAIRAAGKRLANTDSQAVGNG